MKNITLSELKQLKEVKEIREDKATNLKGGGVKRLFVSIFKFVISHNRGFIPPPGS